MPKTDKPSKFRFTNTRPTPLIKDFNIFTRYLERNTFALGKATDHIPYKPLAALNEVMTFPNAENTARTPQEFYPQLHLFYHLSLAGKLFRKIYRKNETRLEATERLAAYRARSPAEKYFFLLETLWIDCSWEELGALQSVFSMTFSVDDFLGRFCDCEPEAPILAKDSDFLLTRMESFFSSTITSCFSLLGWYEIERDEARYQQVATKAFYPIACMTPSALGVALANILMDHRPLLEWNIPHLRSEGMLPTRQKRGRKSAPDFIKLFRNVCEKDELRSSLPREEPKMVRGNFVFKVSVATNVWRVIALSSKHTLDDLHYAIQDAFRFNADHLYAFYMDNQWRSKDRFVSPYSNGPSATGVKISELGLAVNQSFLYHFDFGDDWCFAVQLLEIRSDESALKKPRILETHGKAPEQYPRAEW